MTNTQTKQIQKKQKETKDAAEVIEALKQPDLHTVPYENRYEQLAERLGVNFDTIIFALQNIPLCLNGEAHQEKRRALAGLISANTKAVQDALPGLIGKHFVCLQKPGTHDFINEALFPFIDETLSHLIGTKLDLPIQSYTSRVFSQNIGVAKRQKMESELAALLQRYRTAFPDDSEEELGHRLALTILGRDALLGTISTSLHHYFVHSDDAPLKDLSYEKIPPKTGVPYIDRIAVQRCPVGAQILEEGEVMRVRLALLEDCADENERNGFFGAGTHTCLGRPLSLQIWQNITQHLSRLDTRVKVQEFALRKDDVFHLPETFMIEVGA